MGDVYWAAMHKDLNLKIEIWTRGMDIGVINLQTVAEALPIEKEIQMCKERRKQKMDL